MCRVSQLVDCLRRKGWTLTCAESCTGGLIATRITSVPGASSVFPGAVVAYANRVKQCLLQVSPDILSREGAVSSDCARAMAAGARRLLDCDWSLAVTGIAGPDGGTPAKPVGLVFIALQGPSPANGMVERHFFEGDRQEVREQTAQRAIDLTLQAVNNQEMTPC